MIDLVPPDVRSRLKGLRIVTRRAVGAHGLGLHRSHARGAGLEFAQYRAYEPGDELRQIDWKLYARSDKFFVREAERESPVAVWVLLDTSASMGHVDETRPGQARFAAARGLAACLAELAVQQGDRFGLMALGEEGLRLVPPGSGPRQRDRLLIELMALRPAGGFLPADRMGPLWERIGPRDLVVLISDCFEEAAADLATKLAAAGREVLVIELLTPDERDFPFAGGHRFRDPETGRELLGDGAALRAEFLERFGAARAALRARFAAAGVRHVDHVTDLPLDLPLRRLFAAHAAAEYS
ncbi:DUF58 domain-containing protein [Novosphingobium sp.]|uniref:DUF58 domain-containing protein n=1 Tax=Novosphingobium sp. TaxID=1874826 RepID=UPI002628E7B3|nr:DUF58 domain-containing protein [Novosphingobium sp.]